MGLRRKIHKQEPLLFASSMQIILNLGDFKGHILVKKKKDSYSIILNAFLVIETVRHKRCQQMKTKEDFADKDSICIIIKISTNIKE